MLSEACQETASSRPDWQYQQSAGAQACGRMGRRMIPVISSVNEFADGVTKIKAMAKEAGRDPRAIDFSAFGLAGQWQTAAKISEFKDAGADRVVLWLGDGDLNVVLGEMERLAKAVLV